MREIKRDEMKREYKKREIIQEI